MDAWIYARSTQPLTRKAVVEAIEACRCMTPLRFVPAKTDGDNLDAAWSRLLVEADAGRAPIVFDQVTDDEVVRKAVEELFFILDVSRATKARVRIRELLAHTVRLFRIAFDDDALTEDVRAALPNIAAFIAKSTDAIIRYPERGRSDVFLDANLKQVYRL
ncbi:hypothetical protein AKJ09_02199 [Labilithrix luteola]|uniref:Uncharacterized protein n=1 Tax=Labilithrix luteola TaxID=1391654 RepID=A0A0K1PPR8_9BACT|nr:hypothetical protein [Labilithrix luteola]AKU95535.1 hypothetical protein AKJ09_02199 [Labilithrix luteola]